MGVGASAASAISTSSPQQLAELAEKTNCNPHLVEAIRVGNIDGKEMLANLAALSVALEATADPCKCPGSMGISGNGDAASKSLVLDFNGQTAAWYIRWALDNKVSGYCQWMMKRSWAWSKCREALEPQGWTFDQIQRGIIGCFAESGYGYGPDSVIAWLTARGEAPGEGPPLEEVESTGSVAYRLIKAKTAESQLTYRQTFLTDDPCSHAATHFLSHSWSYPFWSVLEGLINHQLGYDRSWMYICGIEAILAKLDAVAPEDTNYYWFDLFNKNQHIVTSDSTALELEQAGKMVFLLHPMDKWALSRVWCLFEVLICTQVEALLEVTYSFEMVDVFERQKIQDGDCRKKVPWYALQRYRKLSTVDVASAQATVESDRKLILGLIESKVGCEALNEIISAKIDQAFEESSYGLGRERGADGEVVGSVQENSEEDFNVIYDERQ